MLWGPSMAGMVAFLSPHSKTRLSAVERVKQVEPLSFLQEDGAVMLDPDAQIFLLDGKYFF